MIKSLRTNIILTTRNIFKNITNTRTRKHVVSKFANKIGLLYFGTVDQQSDEHRVIRGFTVSSSHKDSHYSVGSIGGYDTTLVDRSDAVWQADGSIIIQNWFIMAFDLHTKQDLPHFFIGARNHESKPYETFFTTFPAIKEIKLGTFEDYSPEFTSRFALYSRPAMSIKIERLLPASAARVLGAHFWPFSAEQNEHVLYLYSSSKKITTSLLETMLENGLWLADQIDMQAELV